MFKGWRTIVFNTIVALGVIVAYLATDTSWAQYVPTQYAALAIVATNVINIVLRLITTTTAFRRVTTTTALVQEDK